MQSLRSIIHSFPEFENIINYKFNRSENILLAMTHSSYANENKNENLGSNERIEFLGDAVLNVIISENIYSNYPLLPEGELSRVRANIVCESSLVKCANNLKLGTFLLLGKGEETTGGRSRTSILCDVFEALIGAIYVDGGFECAKRFVLEQMESLIKDSANGMIFMDFKTQLQEIIQKNNEQRVVYKIIEEKGPAHSKMFVCQAIIGGIAMGMGEGKSKKEAEQNAAKNALEKIKT